MDLPKIDIDAIVDKVKRAQAGENVPGVTVFDGQTVTQALTQTSSSNQAGGNGIALAALAVGFIAILPKRKKKK